MSKAASNSSRHGPIALGAGGTGGHMFPAQAVAEVLKRRGYRVLLITDARGMRYAEEFPADAIVQIKAANPNAKGIAAKASAALALTSGLIRSLQEVRRRGVCAAIGFGGYPSFPALQAAALSKIPFGLHEQNSLLGRANRYLAPKADFLAHGFPTLKGVPATLNTRQIEVGNPVRADVAAQKDAGYITPRDGEPFRLLITGGSQGASLFSRIPAEAIASLPGHLRGRLNVAHQIRENDTAAVERIYADAGVRNRLAPFFTDLPAQIAQAHLVAARAGASTVTEIATIGRPSILVPLATAMDDHQTVNARTLADNNAAMLLLEKKFKVDALRTLLMDLITAPAKLTDMAANTNGLVRQDAANTMADLIEQMIETRS